jgi:hypothetical protein
MPRTYSSIEKIRAELSWLNEPVDPNVCGCRHMLCSEKTGHVAAKCPNNPTEKIWSFRQEYLCGECRSYHFGGSRMRGYMVAR